MWVEREEEKAASRKSASQSQSGVRRAHSLGGETSRQDTGSQGSGAEAESLAGAPRLRLSLTFVLWQQRDNKRC